ncbi:MAG: hypothetical protein ACRD8O_12885, partial [Bryobacteraceae bacterium]
NIQDNYIRSNSLDYQPNLLLLDQVAEFTITTSNASSTVGGGASQVVFVTPSGTNQLHGALYWYNRNNALAAGEWFDNKDGLDKAFLNQNQIGGRLGGPIKRDKLFFYTNYEAYRNRQKESLNRTILTTDARNGLFTYRDAQGAVRKVNILQARGVGIDPAIQRLIELVPTPDKINNFRSGDSSSSLLRNTAGYSFLARSNRTRDNFTTRIDYNLSSKHVLSGSYLWNRDNLDRNDAGNDFSVIPKVTNENHSHLLSAGWRWSPSATFTNEVRGGFNLAPGSFPTTETFGEFLIDGLAFSNPVNQFRNQGRDTDLHVLTSNGSWVRGRHTFQFGYSLSSIRVAPFNEALITPTYYLGMGVGQTGLTGAQLPGIGASDFAAANNLLASLGGFVDAYEQFFHVTGRTSGFVPGAPLLRHLSLDTHSGYIHDTWKLRRRLTLTLGMRYEYLTPVDERDSLYLAPLLQNGNYVTTLLSNATLDFAGKSVSRPFYRSDRNNFAPSIGFAWDLFGTGRTAVRGGYSVAFVNDDHISSLENSVFTNDGLVGDSFDTGLSGRISTGRPRVASPEYKIPRLFSDNFEFNSLAAHAMPDPNLATPYVQQYSFGVQHEYRGTVFELRYVGNHGTKLLRAFDLNQIDIKSSGFLDDFIRARNNGFLSRESTGVFDPRFNPSVPGSQRLPVFGQIEASGLLTNATVRGLIERGEAANLASTYFQNLFEMPFSFHPNPNTNGANIMTNYSNSTYNSLQFDVRRRLKQGMSLQGNYTFSKVLS